MISTHPRLASSSLTAGSVWLTAFSVGRVVAAFVEIGRCRRTARDESTSMLFDPMFTVVEPVCSRRPWRSRIIARSAPDFDHQPPAALAVVLAARGDADAR